MRPIEHRAHSRASARIRTHDPLICARARAHGRRVSAHRDAQVAEMAQMFKELAVLVIDQVRRPVVRAARDGFGPCVRVLACL
jgi:hypothetical protein